MVIRRVYGRLRKHKKITRRVTSSTRGGTKPQTKPPTKAKGPPRRKIRTSNSSRHKRRKITRGLKKKTLVTKKKVTNKPVPVGPCKFSWLEKDSEQLFYPITGGSTSSAWINSDKTLVIKYVKEWLGYNVFEREVYWLKLLEEKGIGWSPRVVQIRKPYLVLTYVGELATRNTIPQDWELQIRRIQGDLSRLGCRHNDIKKTEVLVKNGHLKLIDFQWASKGNDWSCGHGFDRTPKPHGIFNDLNGVLRRILSSK
jgi:hypothetical protein